MSADHCDSIKLRLSVEGFDVEAYERSGQLICVKAEDLLEGFIVKSELDENLFQATIGGLIETARDKVSDGKSGRVRVFGEMVSQLRVKNLTATTRLEEPWNDIIPRHSVPLLCTYAVHHTDDHIPEALIELHSHCI